MDFKDYYKSLGLNSESSDAEIKSTFKKLAKKHHPDASGGSEGKFKEINEAYEVLKDQKKRSKYDYLYSTINKSSSQEQKQRAETYQNSKMYSDAYSDLDSIKDFYKQKQKEYREQQNQRKGKAQKAQESNFSDFFEMFFGKHKERTGNTKKETQTKAAKSSRGDDFEMEVELSLEDAYHGCLRKIEISASANNLRRLEVSIPPGVKSGTKIKVSNEGKPGLNGAPNGDLYLKVKLKEHESMWLEGDDVHGNIKIKPYEAALGGNKKVHTLAGTIELVIPAKTHSGRILRLRDKGLKNSKGEPSGDHYVHVTIDIGDNLSEEELMSYKYLRELDQRK